MVTSKVIQQETQHLQNLIHPNWPVSKHIKAYSTTRLGGISKTPYDSFNLGFHTDDQLESVTHNRNLLKKILDLPAEPIWLSQVHNNHVIQADQINPNEKHPEADASYTHQKNIICAVLTADCLPVFLCDEDATCVAAIHAGWKGLAAGVIEATIKKLGVPGEKLFAWLGPAIGPDVFEVGDEVKEQFVAHDAAALDAFKPSPNNRWLANLYLLAQQRLQHHYVTKIYGGDFCTYTDKDRFFSYRRDKVTGRMGHLIWIEGVIEGVKS